MSLADFYQTSMGRRFFEAHIPKIIETFERIADGIERQNELAEESLAQGDRLEERINTLVDTVEVRRAVAS